MSDGTPTILQSQTDQTTLGGVGHSQTDVTTALHKTANAATADASTLCLN